MVALTGARAAVALTQAAMVSGARAPRAPWPGSFRSMMSAPAPIAISASAASRTLARNRVIYRPCHARAGGHPVTTGISTWLLGLLDRRGKTHDDKKKPWSLFSAT